MIKGFSKLNLACCLTIVAAVIGCQPARCDFRNTTPHGDKGPYGVNAPEPKESEYSVLTPTSHHRLGNTTMFGNSTFQTSSATVEETPTRQYEPTSKERAEKTPEHPSRPGRFRSFSEDLLRAPVVQPVVQAMPSMSSLASPGRSFEGLWPAAGSLHTNLSDLEGFSDIDLGHGQDNNPFSLENLMR